ncbi:MAG: invasin domain 3-containing protein, partial [Longimicrobiales bacterium]
MGNVLASAAEIADLIEFLQQIDITNSRVRIDFPADGTRVVELTQVSGEVLPDVVSVDVFLDGQGPIAAIVENGRFTALVPPELVPALGPGALFELTALATTSDSEPGRDDIEVEANFGAGADAATSTLNASPALITADGVSTSRVTVTPRDSVGDPVGTGLLIEVQTTLGTLGPVADAGDGTYTALLTSAISIGDAVLTANENGGSSFTDDATVRFAVGDVEAVTSTVAVLPTGLDADGISTALVTVIPRDAFGNPLAPGQSVVVSVDLGILGAPLDVGDGSYTAIYTAAATPALATISTTVNGTALGDVTVALNVDLTPPPDADLDRVTFAAPVVGVSQITGGAGSVEALSTVKLTNSATGASVQATADADGSYMVSLAVAPNEEVCVQVTDLAGNLSTLVCTVPFPQLEVSVQGTVRAALAGGGFAPLAGERVELDLADIATDVCNPGFIPFVVGTQVLSDVTAADGSYKIVLPPGVLPDPDFAVVNGTDDDADGIIDTIFAFALVNDVERTVVVDEISTTIPFLICDNDLLLGNAPPAFPESNFSPEERTAIEDTVRDATLSEDFTDPLGALQVIADDVFFDVDGPKDALDTIAFETLREAAETPGGGPPPVFVSGTVTVPSASGEVPLAGVQVDLVTLSFDPLFGATVRSVLTAADGSFTLQKPAAVAEGSGAGLRVIGDLTYDGTGQPGPFDDQVALFSLGAFLTDATAPVAVDLAGRVALSLIDRDISDATLNVTAANYNRSELEELTDLVRTKVAGLSLNLPNRDLSQVFLDAFSDLLTDSDVAALRASIRDPEGSGCNLSASPGTTLEADGFTPVEISIQPLDPLAQPLGAGLLVEVTTTLGTITSPTIDQRDGSYTAFLTAPSTPGTARVTALLPDEDTECPLPLEITFTLDVTAPASPAPGRIVFTGLGASTVTVIGLPGAVEPFSQVTVENATRAVSVTVQAAADGSFRADILAAAGDNLLLRSQDWSTNTSPDTGLVVSNDLMLPAIGNPSALPGSVTETLGGLAQVDLGATVPPGYTYLRGFTLGLVGQDALVPLDVLIESAAPVPPGVGLVLAQVIEVGGTAELRVVAPAASSGGLLFPESGPSFPGVREGGEYAYLAADTELAFVQGVVTGTRGVIQDVLVTADVSPFADLTRAGGSYLLAGPVGASATVSAALFAHGEPAAVPSVRLPFAGAEVSCDFDLPTRADRSFAHTGRFAPTGSLSERLALLPSGDQLYVTTGNTGDAIIVDTAAMAAVSVAEDVVRIEDVAFTPNGFEAFLAYLNRVRDFTVEIEEPGLLISTVDFPKRVAISPDGGFAWVASSVDNAAGDLTADAVYVVDTFTNEVEAASIPVDADPSALALNRAGTRAYITSETRGTLTVIDVVGRSVLDVVAAGAQPEDVAVSPDGAELYLADAATAAVLVLDAALAEDAIPGNELLTTISVGATPSALVLTPDGSQLLVADQSDDTVTLVDVVSRAVTDVWASTDLNAFQALSGSLAMHPDGTRVYVLDRLARQGVLEILLPLSDTSAPRVVDVGPQDRRVDLLQDSPIEIVFGEKM